MPMEIMTAQTFGDLLCYNALPVGKFCDPRYGTVDITPELVTKLAANFGKQPVYELPVKYGHGSDASAAGKISKVEAKPDGLYLTMEINAAGAADLKAGKYHYMSAEYVDDYMDKASGKGAGPALLGVALVNQPGHPGVKPLVFSDGEWKQEKEGDQKKMTIEELTAQLAKLTTQLSDANAKNAELEKKNADIVKLADEMKKSFKTLQDEKKAAEVKLFCDEWTKKGIAPAVLEKIKPVLLADGDGVIKLSDGKDTDIKKLLADVFEVAPKVQLGTNGDPGADGKVDPIKLGDAIAKIANGEA